MPRVPTYDSPQVNQAPLPAARQSTIAGDADTSAARQQIHLGRGMQSFGADLTEIATKQQERENADQVFRAHATLGTEYIAYQAEQSKRQGVDAKGLTQETADWFDKKINEHADHLSNPVQQRAFKQRAGQLAQHGIGTFSHFEVSERQKAAVEAGNANIVSQIDLAASAVGGPMQDAAIGASKKNILGSLSDLRKLDGWSPEVYAAKEKEALTHMHANIIQNINRADPAAAKEYFLANKAEIDGTKYDGIEKLIETGDNLKKAQQAVDVMEKLGMSEEEGLATIRGGYTDESGKKATLEGEARQHAETLWKQRFIEKTRASEASQKEASESVWKIYSKTNDIMSIPADLIEKMDGKEWVALKDHARIRANGETVKTDFGTWYGIVQTMHSEPEKFRKMNLKEYVNKVSENDLQQLSMLQVKAEKPEKLLEARIDQQDFDHVAQDIGLRPFDPKKSEDEKAALGELKYVVETKINAAQEGVKRVLTRDEKMKIVRETVDDRVMKHNMIFRDESVPSALLQRKDQAQAYVTVGKEKVQLSTIPPEFRAQATGERKKRGLATTEQQLGELWVQKRDKKRGYPGGH